MESLRHDLRFALRQLRKSPGFTLTAALTLGLGIGANATVFTWLNWLIRNPLPGVESTGLIYVRWKTPDGRGSSTSWPNFLDIRDRTTTLSHFATGRMTAFSLGEGANPERTFGMLVSANFFDTLGARPALGRTFRPEEDQNPGTHAAAVISDSLWRNRMGGAPDIIGRTIRLNTRPFTVVGVMPPGFQGGTPGLRHDVWVPVMMRGEILGGAQTLTERGNSWLEAYGRLGAGGSIARTTQELNAISAAIARDHYKSERFNRAEVVPIYQHAAGQVLTPVLLMMTAVVGVVLLIVCANVGNLLLARAAGRRKEIAVRMALGVGRGRLVRQLLVENSVLSALGLAIGLAMLPATAGLLMRFAPPADMPIALNTRPGWDVLAFTVTVSVVATLLFGLAPAIRASRADVTGSLKEESGLAGARLRSVLVVAQVALSLVLLVCAGLLLRSLGRAVGVDPGFDPRNVLVAGVDLRPNGYDAKSGAVFIKQALARISSLPGVSSASSVRRVPLGLGGSSSTSFSVYGYTPRKDEDLVAMVNDVGPDYFRTMRTPVLAGRDFNAGDDAGRPLVLVVNETLAGRYFAGVSAVGRRLRAYGREFTIAGVVRGSKYQTLDEPVMPQFWVCSLQVSASETNFLVRTSGDPLAVAKAVEREIHAVDPALPVYGLRSLEDSISAASIVQRMGGTMLGFFGALALLLAAIGLSGVLAYMAAMRSREVGIRMALGATAGAIARMIMAEGMRLAAYGLALGLALSVLVSRFLAKLLFDVSPTDAVTLVSVCVLLAAVSLGASYLPARRAAAVDPLRAIRG